MRSTPSSTYVRTDKIKPIVRGRERDVLVALGITPPNDGQHVRCPYPDHDDASPSWRWDFARACAFCTCTGGDDIFSVVKKVRGVDFEAAKLCVAETIGRHDLIKTKSGGRCQPMDAASLLRPPADQRDDGLPAKYLAHRLGAPIDHRVRGHRDRRRRRVRVP